MPPLWRRQQRQRLEVPAHPCGLFVYSPRWRCRSYRRNASGSGGSTTTAHAWPVDGPGWARRVLSQPLRRPPQAPQQPPTRALDCCGRACYCRWRRVVDDTELQLCAHSVACSRAECTYRIHLYRVVVIQWWRRQCERGGMGGGVGTSLGGRTLSMDPVRRVACR